MILGKNDAKAFRFVSKAINKSDPRKYMSYIHVEKMDDKTIAVATCGRRLHFAELETDLKKGYYIVVTGNQSQCEVLQVVVDLDFPKWNKAIPNLHKMESTEINAMKEWFSCSFFDIARALKTKTIEVKFLMDVLGFYGDWIMYHGEIENHPVIFKQSNITAAIMPIRR